MKKHKLLLPINIIVTFLLFLFQVETNAAQQCLDLFKTEQNALQNRTESDWDKLFKASDLKPRPELWQRIRHSLEKHVTHIMNPLELAGADANKIGYVIFKQFVPEFPALKTLIEIENKQQKQIYIKHSDFIALKRVVANQMIQVATRPANEIQVFAALEVLKYLSIIESRVEFPKTKGQVEKEKQKQQDEEKKKQEEQKKEEDKKKDKDKQKDKKDEEQDKDDQEDDAPPQWNKTEDKYKPENKDISSKGKGKKNVDLLLTDADVPKRLLRQKIYDQFDLKNWSTTPANRQVINHENKHTKKMIIDPLGANEVDIPVPYGHTLIPGKYNGFSIIEVGPGEFKLQTGSKDKVTLGLSKIVSETHLSGLKPTPTPLELSHWPKHLLTFAQTLKGLRPHEAAARLEKYISQDGGFLYYSKGDKLDKDDLSKLDQRLTQLTSQMPKPMAMAHVNAFNCDGAAWIGALLLRDVLGLDVRIAAGRTSAGTKEIDNNKFHVVRSSDPAHAWIEVFENGKWQPFDMTPKNNTPDSDSAPTDLKREQEDKKDQQQNKDQKNKDNQKSDKSDQKQDQQGDKSDQKQQQDKDQKDQKQQDGQKSDSKDGKDAKDKKQDEKKSGETKDDKSKDAEKGEKDSDKKDKDGEDKSDKDHKSDKDSEQEDSTQISESDRKKVEDLIKAKSTARATSESEHTLVQRIIHRNELMTLEHLIAEGHQTKFTPSSQALLEALKTHPNWKNTAERSLQKNGLRLNEAHFSKFTGLQNLINDIRTDFASNQAREAKTKLIFAQKLLVELAEYRQLTKEEVTALNAIQKIISLLDQIKHKNSKEFAAVDDLLKALPGNISKDFLKKQYGADYTQVGSDGNIRLAQDIVGRKLKPLLQMGAVKEFVDMTLNSTQEPQWKEEPTLTRALVPKPRQDLIVTRNPLDFAKMLWNLRPGENMFAPTLQGRQFAMGSLETRRVPNPKNPIERKVSVVYYDISGSMNGHPLETVDALLLAFADRALSEVDAIGRPTHEIYLIPFDDKIYQGVHISSIEDARAFLAQKMGYRTQAAGGTDIQKVMENFYSLISTSFNNKSKQGREKLFQKANMVLFSDGGSHIDMARIEQARKSIPSSVEINMNFVSIGDQINETLKTLSTNGKLSSTKPTFRQMNSQMIDSVVKVSADYDPEAFATSQKLSGQTLTQINELLTQVQVDPRRPAEKSKTDIALGQIQITKADVAKLSGIKELNQLERLKDVLVVLNIPSAQKQRIVQTIIESYPQLTGRSWKDMTYNEKEAFEELRKWSLK